MEEGMMDDERYETYLTLKDQYLDAMHAALCSVDREVVKADKISPVVADYLSDTQDAPDDLDETVDTMLHGMQKESGKISLFQRSAQFSTHGIVCYTDDALEELVEDDTSQNTEEYWEQMVEHQECKNDRLYARQGAD